MKKILVLIFLLSEAACLAQMPEEKYLRSGDLIFQDLDCGPLCDAIEQVTVSYGNRHFSHLGMVYLKNDSIFVIEAIGQAVQATPLATFRSRTPHPMLAARVRTEYAGLVEGAVRYAKQQLGTPYDHAYLYNNGKYYCSELIYDAFKSAQNGKDFFKLEPMTFKQPGKKSFFPAWIAYYKKLNIPVPEGAPGINPGGISTSPLLEIMNQ